MDAATPMAVGIGYPAAEAVPGIVDHAEGGWSGRLLGVRVDDVAASVLVDRVLGAVRRRHRLLVVNANVYLVELAQSRPWLRLLFERADVCFCDGAGVQLGLRVLTGRTVQRHSPPQWIETLGQRLAAEDRSVFWLGGKPDVVAQAAARLTARTGVRSCGLHHGYFDMTPGTAEAEAVVAAINAARPDVLLLVMGMPRQEQWLDWTWDRVDARVALTGGALVDHVAGIVRRPPVWVTRWGLEWLVRLAIEPRRLWRRYVLGLPRFGLRMAGPCARAVTARWIGGRQMGRGQT